MNAAIFSILSGSKSRYVVLDSNLLVLHVTATLNPRLIGRFKRTQMFSEEDATLLAWLLDRFAGVITTSHVMTEASNLGNSLSYIARDSWFAALADFADSTPEKVISCQRLSGLDEFQIFGITDAALWALSEEHTVLTTDGRLASHLQTHGRLGLDFAGLKRLA